MFLTKLQKKPPTQKVFFLPVTMDAALDTRMRSDIVN